MDVLLALVPAIPGPARPVLAGALVSYLVWGVLLLGVRIATGMVRPRPGPAVQDLPGDEPPAVVNVVTNGFRGTVDAAKATFLDLAARGYLELRQPDADVRSTTVHVTTEDPAAAAAAAARRARVARSGGGEGDLLDFERQVLSYVRSIALDGVVPLTALTFREGTEATGFGHAFDRAVMAEVRDRRLFRDRIPNWLNRLLIVTAGVPVLATSAVVIVSSAPADRPGAAGGLVVPGLILWMVLAGLVRRCQGIRHTPEGLAVAERWLGLRAFLAGDDAFADLPPAAVATWDRYVAYGSALGLTRVAAGAIDLGMGDRGVVWSSFGGRWHQVRVRYPARRVRHGRTPAFLIRQALLRGGVGAGLLWAIRRFADDPALAEIRPYLPLRLVVVGAGALVLWSLYRLVRALGDLQARTLTGEVLWIAPWPWKKDGDSDGSLRYLAVDDGTSERTTAWALPPGVGHACSPGDVVTVTVRPWSRRVHSLTVDEHRRRYVAAPAGASSAPDADGDEAGGLSDPVTGLPLPSPEELGAMLGLPLSGPARPVALAGWLYTTADLSGVMVALQVTRMNVLGGLKLRSLRSRGTPVPGLGDEAWVMAEPARSTQSALARRGDRLVMLVIMKTSVAPGVLEATMRSLLDRLTTPTPS